jgi:hypothetical protein
LLHCLPSWLSFAWSEFVWGAVGSAWDAVAWWCHFCIKTSPWWWMRVRALNKHGANPWATACYHWLTTRLIVVWPALPRNPNQCHTLGNQHCHAKRWEPTWHFRAPRAAPFLNMAGYTTPHKQSSTLRESPHRSLPVRQITRC